MKKILTLLLILFVCTADTFAAPLIFKAQKAVTVGNGVFELGSFDAAKYRQVRIAVVAINPPGKPLVSKDDAGRSLARSKRDFERTKSLFDRGVVSKSDYERDSEELKRAQELYDRADEIGVPIIEIVGIDGTDEIPVASFLLDKSLTYTFVMDSPPAKVKIKVSGRGTYSLYVWGL